METQRKIPSDAYYMHDALIFSSEIPPPLVT